GGHFEHQRFGFARRRHGDSRVALQAEDALAPGAIGRLESTAAGGANNLDGHDVNYNSGRCDCAQRTLAPPNTLVVRLIFCPPGSLDGLAMIPKALAIG